MWQAIGIAADKGTTLWILAALCSLNSTRALCLASALPSGTPPRVDQRMVQTVVRLLGNKAYTERIRRQKHFGATPASLYPV